MGSAWALERQEHPHRGLSRYPALLLGLMWDPLFFLSPSSPGCLCGFFHPALRQCFHHFIDNVPFNSWVPFVRELGLTGNEIDVARAEAAGPGDTLYEMLRKWVNKTGRDASVHTLLDALERLGQRLAKQKIQDCLVSSGKFVYLEDNADSAIS
ncbi:Tumor necrosis factor receptor super member 10B [Saguinus oedipus]|uniref:Tumor necrosis factor receptor super member 10B n=1 Tax=Saguinus oedipus TaxID=9490 RepID=A0ABQ9UAI4_SAGOE|nr:Tumor necrosis factor receptor super member 10B [Saguinus oedipus]